MNGFDYWKLALQKYAVFEGRSRRSEYWYFVLFSTLFSIPLINLPLLSSIFSLIMILPNLAVTVRRLHDTGRSGWMILIILIPLIGVIWLFILLVTEGDTGRNQYGPDPKNPVKDDIIDHIVG